MTVVQWRIFWRNELPRFPEAHTLPPAARLLTIVPCRLSHECCLHNIEYSVVQIIKSVASNPLVTRILFWGMVFISFSFFLVVSTCYVLWISVLVRVEKICRERGKGTQRHHQSVVCLTTGPWLLPKQVLHRLLSTSSSSSFCFQYPLVTVIQYLLTSSSAFLRLFIRIMWQICSYKYEEHWHTNSSSRD